MAEIDDDIPQLSAETYAALCEFYMENNEKCTEKTGGVIQENWNLSQFWYEQNTTNVLSHIAVEAAGQKGKVALVCCPTLYTKVKELGNFQIEVKVFDFDKRFSKYGDDYIYYDYREPLKLPQSHWQYYDIVIADPPFLSEECLMKTAETISFMTKGKVILCTGAVMASLAESLLGVKKTSFEPQHANNLANEFWCYSNFDLESFMPRK